MVMFLSKIIKTFFVLIVFFSAIGSLNSQSIEKIDPSKLSNEDLEKLLITQSNQQNISDDQTLEIEDNLIVDRSEEIEDDESKIFGHDFFRTKNETKAPILDIPLLSDYQLTFNDILELTLIGGESKTIELRLDLTGTVIIPEIGKVGLLNLSLEEANEKISKIISDTYIGTNSFLTVKEPSLKKISIIGAVLNPGTYSVNPFISLSEALKYAGGLEDYGSLRNIEVISIDGQKTSVDMYQFLIFGDRSKDLNIKNGDTIKVNSTSAFFILEGAVNRPMVYEYALGDSAEDLISFGLGETRYSDLNSIFINFYDEGEIKTSKVTATTKIQQDLESIYVSSKVFNKNKNAKVVGNIISDGYYEYTSGSEIAELIKKIKFGDAVFPFGFILEQDNVTDNGVLKEKYRASLYDKDTLKNIKLKENIKIYFYSLDDLDLYAEKKTLDEANQENSQENFDSNLLEQIDISDTQEELFNALDNTSLSVLKVGKKEIYLPLSGKVIIKNLIDMFASENIDLENISVISEKEFISSAYSDVVENGELIQSVIAPAIKKDLIDIEITGSVKYPGKYKVARSSKLSQVYSIAGGLSENSNQDGIILTRKAIKEKEYKSFLKRKDLLIDLMISQSASQSNSSSSLSSEIYQLFDQYNEDQFPGRYAGDLSKGSDNYFNLDMQDGDLIYVPQKSNEVTVTGEILSPAAIIFNEKFSIGDYITQAGGVTDFADQRNVYVILANGTTTKNKNYRLSPGDTIVVPKDLDKIDTINIISIISSIFSDLALSAASLNVLRGN